MAKRKKAVSLDSLRHSTAHLLAAAVKEFYPSAKLAIGPAIENGFYYDIDFGKRSISEEDLPKIEEKMRELISSWKSFKGREVTPTEARKIFKDNPYKKELIDEFSKEGQKITVYTSGDFVDLCRGGHTKNPSLEIKHFRLLSTAGAYWRGNEKNPMLTRIYGTVFPTKKELDDYLKRQEEAKKRDHRVLGRQLDLFTFSEEVGAGLPLWTPKGTIIRDELEKWAKETEREWGYQHVVTPHITKEELYKISGHLPYYADDLYSPLDIEGEKYYLKPMNCPHTHMIYKSKKRSYRELPLRWAEYGTVYRFERSGVLHGLMRVRGFCQNDAHVYVQPELAVEEFIKVFDLHRYYYKILGIDDWWVVLGLRDPKNHAKYHGDDEMWRLAEKLSKDALKKAKVTYEEEMGGAAHYGPKADVYIRSVVGNAYAIGTDQLDLYMPKQFDLKYTDSDGKEKMPYIIHRAPLGSHERMVGFLIEHYAGAFPVWLSPVQVVVIPISKKFAAYGRKVGKELKNQGVRVEVDNRDATMQAKIREAQTQKVPYMFIVGEKEKKKEGVAVRLRDGSDLGVKGVKVAQEKIASIIKSRSLEIW